MILNNNAIPPILNPWGGDTNPAIFIFAHQDDETLTFGAEIEAHKKTGRYLVGVLGTDGRTSSVRGATDLGVRDFVRARNLEMVAALNQLGMDELHMMGATDGSLTQSIANNLANFWFQKNPKASFKVPSDVDDHPDHAAIGKAFRSIKKANPSSDIRFYVKPEQWSTSGKPLSWTSGSVATRNAAAEYKLVDKPNGRYGIGYLSVPGAFDKIIATPKSGWHF